MQKCGIDGLSMKRVNKCTLSHWILTPHKKKFFSIFLKHTSSKCDARWRLCISVLNRWCMSLVNNKLFCPEAQITVNSNTSSYMYPIIYIRVLGSIEYKHPQQIFRRGVCPRGVLKRWTAESLSANSHSTCAITFTFGQIPLEKVWTTLSSQLWVK